MKLFSVIVCFNPDWDNVKSLVNALNDAEVHSIVVDNSDSVHEFSSSSIFEYLPLCTNLGIAEAQNKGVELALTAGADAVIFFDQDSRISTNFISLLIEPLITGDENIVAPIFKSIKHGFFYKIVKYLPSGKIEKITPVIGENFHTNIAISSGTVVKKAVIEKVGLMKSELFIDYVDTEWCLRAYKMGYEVCINTNAVMDHEIGDTTIKLFKFNVPIHSAFRRYYRIRNSFLLFRYDHIPKKLAVREALFSVIHQLILILYCDNKIGYVKTLFKGIRDGVLNRAGK